MILNETNLQLLGDSQTFIGLLASLLIVFILLNNNNLLNKIVKKVLVMTENEIRKIKNQMREHLNLESSQLIENLEDTNSYSNESNSNSEQNQSKDKVNVYLENMIQTSQISATNLGYTRDIFDPIITKIQEIKYSEGRSFTPFLLFIYCIILFICDEICHFSSNSYYFTIVFLIFLTLLLAIFLIAMWGKFIYERLPRKLKVEDSKSKNFSFKDYVFNSRETFLIICIFYVSVICGIRAHNSHLFISFYNFWLILMGSIIIIMGITSLTHINKRYTNGRYGYSFIFFHTIFLIGISIFFAYAFTHFFDYTKIYLPNNKSHLIELRFYAIIFIFIFGVVFPILIPVISSGILMGRARLAYKRYIKYTNLDTIKNF